jgi:Zn-dependent metalloprotease
MCVRNPIECILPPYILGKLAESANELLRRLALDNLVASAQARVMRALLPTQPNAMMAAAAGTPGKKHRVIYDMRNRPPWPFLLPGKKVRSEGEPRKTDVAVNEAYDYSGFTYDFYKTVYDRNSLDNRGMPLISSVHVGDRYNNAFWNGQQMAYGDGDEIMFTRFTKSMDVVGHELTHGVVTHTCDLEYQDEPGALNEHFADVFGCLVRQWKKKQKASDAKAWLIGAELMVPAPTRRALRDMANPGTAFKDDPELGDDPQPDHMSKKYTGQDDYGGVHINSGIPNKAFTLVAKKLGGSAWIKPGRIWYKTMLKLTARSNFQECATETFQTAAAEFGQDSTEQKAVKDAWADVGITVE